MPPSPRALAVRAELAAVTAAACAATTATPAGRLEPAVLLLARHLAPGLLGPSLGYLLDALLPDGIDLPDPDEYFLHLQPLLDGDWDLRGHLDYETGTLLAREIDRQHKAQSDQPTDHPDETEDEDQDEDDQDDDVSGGPVDEMADAEVGEEVGTPDTPDTPATAEDTWTADGDPHASTSDRPGNAGTTRSPSCCATPPPASPPPPAAAGPPPPRCSSPAASKRWKAGSARSPAPFPPAASRSACSRHPAPARPRQRAHRRPTLDAAGHPVGASSTRRSANRKERAALRVQWGPWCAIDGCVDTDTVPHHVPPWWLTRTTRLRDLLPLCKHDHRAVHEQHRTLSLKDGRHIDELGWTTMPEAPCPDPIRSAA